MKSHRMSRSTEIRNGHKAMVARGRSSLSRFALLDYDQILTGRRFRRANKLTHEDARMLDVFIRRPDGTAVRPMVTVEIDERTRLATDWRVII